MSKRLLSEHTEHKPNYLLFNYKEDFIENLAKEIYVRNHATPYDCFEAANKFWEEMEKRRKEKALQRSEG